MSWVAVYLCYSLGFRLFIHLVYSYWLSISLIAIYLIRTNYRLMAVLKSNHKNSWIDIVIATSWLTTYNKTLWRRIVCSEEHGNQCSNEDKYGSCIESNTAVTSCIMNIVV